MTIIFTKAMRVSDDVLSLGGDTPSVGIENR